MKYMKFKDRPPIGTKVTCRYCMIRRYNGSKREWAPMSTGGTPIKGIYIGWRDLQNGWIKYNGYDEPSEFNQTSLVRCALVVVNERKNPIRVPMKFLELDAPPEPDVQNNKIAWIKWHRTMTGSSLKDAIDAANRKLTRRG